MSDLNPMDFVNEENEESDIIRIERNRLSASQFGLMVDFLTLNPELVHKKITTAFTKEDWHNKWEELTSLLNSDGTGAKKDAERWRRSWKDQKFLIKSKAAKHDLCKNEFGKSPYKLNDLEERVLKLIITDPHKKIFSQNVMKSQNIQQTNYVPQEMGPTNYILIGVETANDPVKLEPIQHPSLKLDHTNNIFVLEPSNLAPIRFEPNSIPLRLETMNNASVRSSVTDLTKLQNISNIPIKLHTTAISSEVSDKIQESREESSSFLHRLESGNVTPIHLQSNNISTKLEETKSMSVMSPVSDLTESQNISDIPVRLQTTTESSEIATKELQESRGKKESTSLIVKLQPNRTTPKTVSERLQKYHERNIRKKRIQKDGFKLRMRRMWEKRKAQASLSRCIATNHSSVKPLLGQSKSRVSENLEISSASEEDMQQPVSPEIIEENLLDSCTQDSSSNSPKKKLKAPTHSYFQKTSGFGITKLLQRQNELLECIAGTLARIEKSVDDRASTEVQRKNNMLVNISENIERLAESLVTVSKSLKSIAEK